MRVSLIARRPPTLLEQVLGRQRARRLRRRLGLAAVGAGVTLLRPRSRWVPIGGSLVLLVALGLWVRG